MIDEEDLKKKAEEGHLDSQKALALAFELGLDRPMDMKQSFYWWQKAAEAGDALAKTVVAEMHATGEGTEVDLKEAKQLFMAAECQGMKPWYDTKKFLEKQGHKLRGGKKQKKVLIVDDSNLVRIVMSEIITNLDAIPVTANNGQEGLKKVIADPDIDLVFLDLNMPILNGLQCLASIRNLEDPALSKKPVVILTTESKPEYIKSAVSLKVNGWIIKPAKSKNIEEILNKIPSREA